MKSYTDLEQSKKLAEILPLESADMYFHNRSDIPDNYPLLIEWKHNNPLLSQDIPCWSLAALLNITCMVVGRVVDSDIWICASHKLNLSLYADNPIDAAFDMICWLLENEKI